MSAFCKPCGGGRSSRWSPGSIVHLAATVLMLYGPGADARASGGGEDSGQKVELERLLQLPESFDAGGERRGGASESEWRGRFLKAREDVDATRHSLDEAQKQLESLAGDTGSYQVAAPGATDPQNSPVSFQLRQEIRRHREELGRAEKRQRALDVQANLADVPEPWRQ